jgi:hypothetical protein
MSAGTTLSEALAPVLRDLENSGTLLPDILDKQERHFDGRISAMPYGPNGATNPMPAVMALLPTEDEHPRCCNGTHSATHEHAARLAVGVGLLENFWRGVLLAPPARRCY